MIEKIGGLVIDTKISTIVDRFSQSIRDHKDKIKIIERIKSHFELERKSYFDRFDLQEDYDFEGLLEFILSNGIDNILRIITVVPANDALYTSFIQQCHAYSSAITQASQDRVSHFVNELIDIVRSLFIEKISAEHKALAQVSNQGVFCVLNDIQKDIKQLQTVSPNGKHEYSFQSENTSIPTNNILRYVRPCKMLVTKKQDENFCIKQTLWQALQDHKHIVLLGSAGAGKTIALKQLCLSSEEPSVSLFFISLKQYPNIPIFRELQTYQENTPDKYVFVFDGFDEISPDKIGEFSAAFNELMPLLKNSYVVVSSRFNAYNDQLKHLEKYEVVPFSDEDQNMYLEKENIIPSSFRKEVLKQRLYDLCRNAFFFVELVEIYKKSNGNLPIASEVMDSIVQYRLRDNLHKYEISMPDLKNDTAAFLQAIEKIAFVMQCVHRSDLTDDEIKTITQYATTQSLSLQGLLVQTTDCMWTFTHNNFREYFAAKYLNGHMQLDQVLLAVGGSTEASHIKPSWMNVVSYLATIRRKDDLWQWICVHDPLLITHFEKERFSTIDLLTTVLTHLRSNCYLLERNHGESAAMGHFFSEKEEIDLLLQSLCIDQPEYQKLNILRILQHVDSLHNHKAKVREVVRKIILDDNEPLAVKADAFRLMSAFSKVFAEDAHILISAYQNSESLEMRGGLLQFLIDANLFENHLDVFLNSVPFIFEAHRWDRYFLQKRIRNELLNVKHPDSAYSIIKLFQHAPKYYFDDNLAGIFANCCELAARFYTGSPDRFTACFISMISSGKSLFAPEFQQGIRKYMVKTGTDELFLAKVLEMEPIILYRFLQFFLTEAVSKLLIEKYTSEAWPYPYMIEDLIRWLPENNPYHLKLQAAVFKKTGTRISVSLPIDYEQLQREGHQMLFDSLFSEEAFDHLVHELGCLFGMDESIHSAEDHHPEQFFENLHDKVALYELYFILWHWFEKHPEVTYRNYRQYIKNWEVFSYLHLTDILTEKKGKINISVEQKDILEHYTVQQMEKYDFSKIATISKNHITFSQFALCVIRMIQILDISPSKDKLLSMLLVPSSLFIDHSSYSFPAFLTDKLDPQDLRQQVLTNIESFPLKGEVAAAHIDYCMQNQIKNALDFAINFVLQDETSIYGRHVALEYVYRCFGVDVLYSRILPFCNDDSLLKEILYLVHADDYNDLLDRHVIEAYHRSRSTEFLKYMLRRNIPEALDIYYDMSDVRNSIPDFTSDNNISDVTEAIEHVSDAALATKIINLLKLLERDGFKDKPSFGLYRSCKRALINMASSDFKKVSALLRQELHNTESHYALGVSDILYDVNVQHYVNEDHPMDFKDALLMIIDI